jgi:cytidine deaminase
MNKQLLQLAIKKAQQTTCRYKIFCIAFNSNGDVLGITCNKRNIDKQGCSIHAEIMALKRFNRKIKSVIIGRTNNKGHLLPIDPCHTCKNILNRNGINIKTIKDCI